MREIEVKAKLRDKNKLLKKASELGISFGESIIQDDSTYETSIPKDDPNWNIFRIRKQNEKTILTIKYRASSISRDNHERESIIEDSGEVVDMLARVGYTLGVRIEKTRRTAKYKDLEICIDEVNKLGTFIEVEKLTNDDADVDLVQNELWKLLEELGVDKSDRIHKGYDTLMYEILDTEK